MRFLADMQGIVPLLIITLQQSGIQQKQNDEELEYLESVLNALENAVDDADLSEIRTELACETA